MKVEHSAFFLFIPLLYIIHLFWTPDLLRKTETPTVSPSRSPIQPFPATVEFREDTADLLEKEDGMFIGAEIGVQSGHFAANNLNKWTKCKRYYLIDVWQKQQNYNDLANVDNKDQENLYKKTLARIDKWKDKVVVLRMFSSNASLFILDNELDFVYFDARHDYCGVSEDLKLYWPKVRYGGIMAGRDYTYGGNHNDQDWTICANGSHILGSVKRAVNEFADEHGYQVHLLPRDRHSWMIRKT